VHQAVVVFQQEPIPQDTAPEQKKKGKKPNSIET